MFFGKGIRLYMWVYHIFRSGGNMYRMFLCKYTLKWGIF